MTRYRASVVDDEDAVRGFIIECLNFSNFEAVGYAEAELLLQELFFPDQTNSEQPDLIIIDLQLKKGRMQGLKLITELEDRNVPAEILAISGNSPAKCLSEAIQIGAVAFAVKPFDNLIELISKMERLAKIGRKRRIHRMESGVVTQETDSSRHRRPVFLSYSNHDKNLAMGLRRSIEAADIGVWYAPDTLAAGDMWRDRIKEGIDHAKIFIPLLSDEYASSKYCMAELLRFFRLTMRKKDRGVRLLPVMGTLTEKGLSNSLIKQVIDKYNYIDISHHFVDSLTVFLGRIQQTLKF